MSIHFSIAAAGLIALALTACNEAPADLPVPITEPLEARPAPDTSVPTASSVFAPTADVGTAPAAGRAVVPMTGAQESVAMPMPGQNNDHSAPLPPAVRASGTSTGEPVSR